MEGRFKTFVHFSRKVGITFAVGVSTPYQLAMRQMNQFV